MENDKLTKIAQEKLSLHTLETRNLDGLDFHEFHVSNLKAALEAAYEAGRQSVTAAPVVVSQKAWEEKHYEPSGYAPSSRSREEDAEVYGRYDNGTPRFRPPGGF